MGNLKKPGQMAEKRKQYKEVGPRGGKVNIAKQYTMDNGKRQPAVKRGNKLKRMSRERK